MTIRGVIFDYGMVLSNAQDPVAHQRLLEITGLDLAIFEDYYWQYRHIYDEGHIDGVTYWRWILADTGLTRTPEQINELIEQDLLMWSSVNEEMLAWATALHNCGMRTAILSNMGEDHMHHMRREFAWLQHFDHLTWSCELKIAKPDPGIYTYTCEKLGVEPCEALFLDDKLVNVEAARSVGLKAIQFENVTQLRQALEAQNLLSGWPQPDSLSAV